MKRRRVLYVDNFNNFDFYLQLAKSSEFLEFRFIVFSKVKYYKCILNGIQCNLFKCQSVWNFKWLGIAKKNIDISIKNDRLLRFLPRFVTKPLMAGYAIQFLKVLDEFKPSVVLGEISWSMEYIFYMICEVQGIRYRHILNLPLNRVKAVAFDAEHSIGSLEECRDIKCDYSYRMSYADLCQKVKEYYSARKKHVLSASSSDYREFKLLWMVSSFHYWLSKLLYGTAYKLFASKYSQVSDISSKRIIYFPLHVQPESTPDYVSPFYANQLTLLKRISVALGDDYVLLAKEHPNKFSARSVTQLISALRHENIYFIRAEESSALLLKQCEAVMTVAGTTALEATAIGKPAVTFSNIFYNAFSGVVDGRKYLEDGKLQELMMNLTVNKMVEDIPAGLAEYGVEGFVHDPRIFPLVTDSENIDAICELVLRICELEG